jgi:SAM-dependent methyltransferase
VNVREYNREAWNKLVDKSDRWTCPVSPETVADARKGVLNLLLTPAKFVPRTWYPPLKGAKVLCLASGGGQQGPLLAASGADVTVFDNSPRQLDQDRLVAEREGLALRTVEGDMRDLSVFSDGTFDLIFHPCSNAFVDDIKPVWKECFRVAKPGGSLLSGFSNPVIYLFDLDLEKQGIFTLKYSAPFSDLTSISEEERRRHFGEEPLNFGHSLDDQIGAQLDAGFHMTGFFEDTWGGQPLDKYFKAFIATKTVKPA